jgi:RNA polymerase sigma-70 factor, ECF subfamily
MSTGGPSSSPQEAGLLDAARAGDEDAFRKLVEPHRGVLHAHCYRMLGSLHDADDALQETLLRAWRGLSGFESGRPLRPWLYAIASNTCLTALATRPKRVLPIESGPPAGPEEGPGAPMEESLWLEPYPDEALELPDGYSSPAARYEQRESVELAFIAALQHLPARQRAVLILRDVLGFKAKEVAEALETTVAAVNSALQRARKTVEERLPARSQQATLRSLGDDGLRKLVEDYVRAWESRDVDAMVAMLVEDAIFAMPPHPSWWRGAHDVVAFVTRAGRLPLRHIPVRANGQPAIGWYVRWPNQAAYTPASLEVLAIDGTRVKEITAFALPDLFERFGLPEQLAETG